eukprot:scaffold11434_cov115-Skeletonema_marinoi.AAC.3
MITITIDSIQQIAKVGTTEQLDDNIFNERFDQGALDCAMRRSVEEINDVVDHSAITVPMQINASTLNKSPVLGLSRERLFI